MTKSDQYKMILIRKHEYLKFQWVAHDMQGSKARINI